MKLLAITAADAAADPAVLKARAVLIRLTSARRSLWLKLRLADRAFAAGPSEVERVIGHLLGLLVVVGGDTLSPATRPKD